MNIAVKNRPENNQLISMTGKEIEMTTAFFQEFPIAESFELLSEDAEDILTELGKQEEALRNKIHLYSFMGESTEELDFLYESEQKSFFEKIGQLIIDIINGLVEFAKKMKDKVMSLFKKEKNTAQEIDVAWRKNPELAQAFMDGLKNGSIKYSDYENIDKMVDEACDIIRQLEQDKIDSKTGIEKFNACIEKFEKNLKPSMNLLATIGVGIGGIVSIVTFRNKLRENTIHSDRFAKKIKDIQKTAAEAEYKANNAVPNPYFNMTHYPKNDKIHPNKRGQKIKPSDGINTTDRYLHTSSNPNDIANANKRTALEWSFRISQRAATEYSRTAEFFWKILADTAHVIGKLPGIGGKAVDAQTHGNDSGTTSKEVKDRIMRDNNIDKGMR